MQHLAFEAEWSLQGKPFYEASYVLLRRGHVLVFQASAATPAGLKEAEKSLQSIRWD